MNVRPIDANMLVRAILEERDKIPLQVVERYSFGVPTPYRHGQSMRGGIRKALRCVEEMPTLEYAPVRHGYWKDGRCSECGTEASYTDKDRPVYDYDWEENLRYSYTETDREYHETTYCPNCGALMDARKDCDRE